MTDDERVQEIRQRINGSCRWRDVDILFLLDKLEETERRGMERAAKLIQGQEKPGYKRETYAAAIRAEAAKLNN